MFTRAAILIGCLWALGGCVYNDEPMPAISHVYPQTPLIIGPSVPPRPPVSRNVGIKQGWVPPRHLEDKKRWHGIVIHHSAVPYGSAAHEDKYHKSIGWDGLGYHFVINNGVFENGYGRADGLVEVGYRWRGQKVGSHCRQNSSSNYWNEHTVGICLIGNFSEGRPTFRQMQSLAKLVRFLRTRYSIPISKIKGHGDIKPTDCPGKYFPMARLKSMVN